MAHILIYANERWMTKEEDITAPRPFNVIGDLLKFERVWTKQIARDFPHLIYFPSHLFFSQLDLKFLLFVGSE